MVRERSRRKKAQQMGRGAADNPAPPPRGSGGPLTVGADSLEEYRRPPRIRGSSWREGLILSRKGDPV